MLLRKWDCIMHCFLVSPATAVPFRKRRSVISFQRSSCSNFHHACYPIIEELATFAQQMSTSFLKEYFTADKLTLVWLMVRGERVMINNKYFSHIFRSATWFAKIFFFLLTPLVENCWEPLLGICRQFYATLYGTSVAFCELENQGWSRILPAPVSPAEWKGPTREGS